jgi:hypothetical protein
MIAASAEPSRHHRGFHPPQNETAEAVRLSSQAGGRLQTFYLISFNFLESHISCRAVWIASRTALATAVVFYLRSIIELTPSRRMYCLCADKLSARSGRVNKSQDRHIPVVTAT